MTSSPVSEVRYYRPAGFGGQLAIMELFSDGSSMFWSQEFGEVRWYEFTPDAEERAAVLTLVGKEPAARGWARL